MAPPYFPSSIATEEELIIAVNNKRFTLTDDLAADGLEIKVSSTTGAPDSGLIGIGTELIWYTSKTSLKFICDDINKRGFDGTTPTIHEKTVDGGEVYLGPAACYHNYLVAELIGIETELGINGANYIKKSLVTTKGDLIAGTASATVARLGKGTDGYLLSSNSGESAGLKWIAAPQGGGVFLDVPGTPVRVSDTQFTITDTGNAGLYDLLLSQGTVLRWMESTTFQTAIVESSSYATDTVTVNIIGNSLTAGFTSMKYSVVKAHIMEFIIPGTIATGTDLAKTFYMPCDGYIIAADGYHKIAGTTNNTTYDINDDGSTLFSSKLTIASGATTATFLAATDPSALVAKDSLITVDCDSVSTTPPVEAYIYIYMIPASWRYIT